MAFQPALYRGPRFEVPSLTAFRSPRRRLVQLALTVAVATVALASLLPAWAPLVSNPAVRIQSAPGTSHGPRPSDPTVPETGGPSAGSPAPTGEATAWTSPRAGGFAGTGPASASSIVPLAPSPPKTVRGWNGINASSSSCSCAPPDVQVAAGPSQIVEMVNLQVEIWTKTGTKISSTPLSKFWGTGGNFVSDPQILYDNVSGRFFATLLDVNLSSILVGVANNTAHTANTSWNIYAIGGPGVVPSGAFPDQPWLGIDNGVIALGGNDYGSSGFVGGQLFFLPKAPVIAGTGFSYAYYFANPNWFSTQPVRSLGSATTEWIVNTYLFAGRSMVRLFQESGTPPATVTLATGFSVNVSGFSAPPGAAQPGTADQVDTSDYRIVSAVAQSGTIWLAFTSGCTPKGDSTVRTCVRVAEVNTTGARPTLLSDQTFSAAGMYFFYPALTMNRAGNVSLVYGFSNGTSYPSLAYRIASPTGVFSKPITLKVGSAAATVVCSRGQGNVCRFGDYFGAAFDPKGPDAWFAGEYGAPATFWFTWVAEVLP
jgi:hypothetical protein